MSGQKQKTIDQRLKQVSLFTILVVALIALTLYAAIGRMGNTLDHAVGEQLKATLGNSENSVDFGLLYSRLRVFQNTFFGKDEFLTEEGLTISSRLKALQKSVTQPGIKGNLRQLSTDFERYLERCEWINQLIRWRSDQDQDIQQMLQILQELLSERIIEAASKNEPIDYYEQLVLLMSGYRESLFEIEKLNAQEDPLLLLKGDESDLPPLQEKLNSLALRLRGLTATEPPFDRIGRHLISRVEYYHYLMRVYQLELIQLGLQNTNLKARAETVLASLEDLDAESASAVYALRADIKQKTYALATLIFALLLMLALVLWTANRRLFRKHIQIPLALISDRLQLFQQGDLVTPMALGRTDEWQQIEKIFNNMLSALKEKVAALSTSEKRYREIFFNATEGIFHSTLSGHFIELNPAAAQILGCDSVAEAKTYFNDIGRQLYLNPQDRAIMLEALNSTDRCLNYEVRMKRKNGEEFWCVENNHLVRDGNGNPLYIEGTIQDISQRVAAQTSLHQIRSYLQDIIDSMPSILIGVDSAMRVMLWNKRAEQESFLSATQAKGLSMFEVCRLFDPASYLPSLEETLKTGLPQRLERIKSIKKRRNGGYRYFDILIYPLSFSGESGAVIHMDDVTERVGLQDLMVRSEKMRSVGNLASGLAHEINNPLAVILQNAQVLSRRLSPELKKNAEVAESLGTTIETINHYVQERGGEKILQVITDAGQRAAKIVTAMQSFSRAHANRFVMNPLADIIEQSIELVRSDYDMRYHYNFQRIQIIREFQAVPPVLCESSQIQQAIFGLLKNAAQALSEKAEDPRLLLRLFERDEWVCLQVEDNGAGMPDDVRAHIFEPFYSTQKVGGGSGLGLSIAYFIVTQTHKGALLVTTEPGKGTVFEMQLPIAGEAPEDTAEES